jgi:ABC-type transporter Mla MlaB component
MIIEQQDGRVIVTLPPVCTIAEVETGADRIRRLSEVLTTLEIRADAVQEMDTAYLQLLLALKATAEQRAGVLTLQGISPEVTALCDLYGVTPASPCCVR